MTESFPQRFRIIIKKTLHNNTFYDIFSWLNLGGPPKLKKLNISLDVLQKGVLGGALGGSTLSIFHYTYSNMAFLDAPIGGPPELTNINISLDVLQECVLGGAVGAH